MKAIKDTKNDLLKRRELKFLVNSESNPGYDKAKEIVAKEFKAEADVVAVKNVKSKFGRDTFLIDAFIYSSAADRLRIEPKIRVKKAAGAA